VADPVLLLLLINFGLIALLPRIFFRRDGSFNARWWSTALPVGAAPIVLVLARVLHLAPVLPASWLPVTGLASIAVSALSIGLIAQTLGTHRIPIALWHQTDDAPRHIVTWGAYRLIRHPFYAAFLVAFTAAVLAFPHWLTAALLIYMVVMLNRIAAREEQQLAASEFGAEYREYLTRTGRFLPRLARPAAPANQEVIS
jgi:protein-S-isoprenylcysteine O-methyltransferase Ste14